MDSNGITDQDPAKVRMLFKAYTEHYTYAYLFYTHMLFMYLKKMEGHFCPHSSMLNYVNMQLIIFTGVLLMLFMSTCKQDNYILTHDTLFVQYQLLI